MFAGYTGARCEINVNECEEDRNICGHGVCYDTYGSYVCACQLGYKGDRCNNVRNYAASDGSNRGAFNNARKVKLVRKLNVPIINPQLIAAGCKQQVFQCVHVLSNNG